jgi:hypothetical protein
MKGFPIGSLESRAAARMRLAYLNENRKLVRMISSIPRPGADNSCVHFGEWQKWDHKTFGQQVYLPHVWVKPGEAVPICLDGGTPFKKTGEYLGMVGFQAQCMDKHDLKLVEAPHSRLAVVRHIGLE